MILILKLVSIVVVMIVLLRLKVNLAVTILLLSVQTVLLFGVNVETSAIAWAQALVAGKTLKLMVIVASVIYIASVQKIKHMFDRLISSLNTMVRDTRVVAAMGPAIVGLLPMPGGALMSAPLVEVSTREMNLEPEFNTFINYWFRHLWEYVWPVYSSLLLFQALSGIPMKTVILYQAPFTLLNILTGAAICYMYYKKHGIKRGVPPGKTSFSRTVKDFFEGVWP
ncbi:MAG: DUF401 family protein, partial [bacterium]|nr:DUF401 family protein [bacterium]